MARQEIILGTPPQGLGGDTPRVASMKINAMTSEIYKNLPTAADPLPISNGGTGGKTKEDARTGLGLGSAAVAAIVGIVSQADGVPNGALMQYTSTANGECWRFASGLMIATKSTPLGAVNISVGALFTCFAAGLGGFPANFVVPPTVIPIGAITSIGGGWGACYSFPTTSTWGAWAVYNHASNAGPSRLDLIAIGRWF